MNKADDHVGLGRPENNGYLPVRIADGQRSIPPRRSNGPPCAHAMKVLSSAMVLGDTWASTRSALGDAILQPKRQSGSSSWN